MNARIGTTKQSDDLGTTILVVGSDGTYSAVNAFTEAGLNQASDVTHLRVISKDEADNTILLQRMQKDIQRFTSEQTSLLRRILFALEHIVGTEIPDPAR